MEKAFLERIDTVFLRVPNLEQTLAWYLEHFGFSVKWRTDVIATLQIGGTTPITLVQQDTVAEEYPLFNFYTEDIEDAYDRMTSAGIRTTPIRDYGTVQLFDFWDEDGHVSNVCHY